MMDDDEMTTTRIRARLDALVARMAERGLPRPEAVFQIEAGGARYRVRTDYFFDDMVYGTGMEFHLAETGEDALRAAEVHVDTIPTGADRLREKAAKSLGTAIEACRAADVDDKLVSPLEVAMKRLSENILTGPGAP